MKHYYPAVCFSVVSFLPVMDTFIILLYSTHFLDAFTSFIQSHTLGCFLFFFIFLLSYAKKHSAGMFRFISDFLSFEQCSLCHTFAHSCCSCSWRISIESRKEQNSWKIEREREAFLAFTLQCRYD